MAQVSMVHDFASTGWIDTTNAAEKSRSYCECLERGDILFFEECPFDFPEAHQLKLLEHRQSGFRYHKNVSFQPLNKRLRGSTQENEADRRELVAILEAYSAQVSAFVERFLIPYRDGMRIDYASYRPVEEAGRKLSLHKRNDLLHVDAFPNRPTRGGRILRVFTNINPREPRIWNTAGTFEELAEEHAEVAGLSTLARRSESSFWKVVYGAAAIPRRIVGGSKRSPTAYDRFMHRFHNYLKENGGFQTRCSKMTHAFPPGSSWIVFTDSVPHAVLSGQFALEQTYIVDLNAMVAPQQAPLKILERICGKKLAA